MARNAVPVMDALRDSMIAQLKQVPEQPETLGSTIALP
jgi:hypothetical protein